MTTIPARLLATETRSHIPPRLSTLDMRRSMRLLQSTKGTPQRPLLQPTATKHRQRTVHFHLHLTMANLAQQLRTRRKVIMLHARFRTENM